jgi:aspartate kinase
MKVYKFGGASVKDAEGIRNLVSIVKQEMQCPIIMVVSAMGKTTNAFEKVLHLWAEQGDWKLECNRIKFSHLEICISLGMDIASIQARLESFFSDISLILQTNDSGLYDFVYDQVVSYGEIISTTIIHEYLLHSGLPAQWADARKLIVTDSTYRAARVNLDATEDALKKAIGSDFKILIIQGFIGHDSQGYTTTLGREGSDYTAALMAYSFRVPEVTIWKDVPGVFSADPKVFKNAKLILQLSYKEAVELAFYGASIIHPKTIQPLQTRRINLRVRSFYDIQDSGSLVSEAFSAVKALPSIILKRNQILLSVTPRDFSFMDVANMGLVFQILARHQHHINLIQNSAISFSLCMDYNHNHFDELFAELSEHFETRYNLNQVLITIRHYDSGLIDKIYDKLNIKLEQRNRSTYQMVMGEDAFETGFLPLVD